MKKVISLVALLAVQSSFSQNVFPTAGFVGIGTVNPYHLLEVDGTHQNSRILLHSLGNGENTGQADLMLWASEPGISYTGVGIGNNIHNFREGSAQMSLLNPARGGSYIRLLDNKMLFNVVAASGLDKQALSINASGNVGIGTLEPQASLDLGKGYGKNGAKLLIYNDDPSSELAGTKCGFYMDNFTSNNLNLVFPEYQDFPGLFTISAKNTVSTTLNPYFSIVGLTGNVGIGTTNPTSKLTVAGNIHAQEVKVTINAGAVPDYVFANDYKLKSLDEVEDYIKQNSHLPEIPSATEMEKNGLMLAEMNLSLLKKIEELTLYTIELNKKNIALEQRLEKLETR